MISKDIMQYKYSLNNQYTYNYYRNRYYHPYLARFSQMDKLANQLRYLIYSFAYVNDNPPNLIDPTGFKVINNSSCTIWVKEELSEKTHAIPPGGTWDQEQDGISVPCHYPCRVFMSCNHIDIIVDGNLCITTSGGNWKEQFCQFINMKWGGSWKDRNWVNEHNDWKELFKKSVLQGKENCHECKID